MNIPRYGWMAVQFAVLSYLIYIAALLCSHLAAFRVATNLRLAVSEHLAVLPLGFRIRYFGEIFSPGFGAGYRYIRAQENTLQDF